MGTAAFSVLEQEGSPWILAHRALSRLAKERAAADAEEGRWLLAALRSATHLHLGFGSFSEYVERSFGYKPRSTQEKLRVAEALEEVPVLAGALAEGTLHWSAVRELTRVVAPETEREWLDVAQGKTIRQLEELIAGKSQGDTPASPSQPCEQRHVLRFEVAPETLALFREALAALRRSSPGALDDDAALLALARLALGGPRDEGRASYQIALSVCAECGRGQQPSGGELVAVGAEIVEMAHCDGQHLGNISPRAANDSVPGQTSDAHVSADLHAESAATETPVPTRAKQTIPPALRRTVLTRDHRRCRVPGCRNTVFVDVHHIQLRAEGGRNAAENLITLCGVHHRASHRGQLLIEGASETARFRHADGSPYGRVEAPQAFEAQAKAFAALRSLGFREGDVRAAMARLRDERELVAGTTEEWLRAALGRLTPRQSRV
ncbi:MAG TPA: HNH endonuclease [Polyangiaceae bacterium]|nr:HNH endonuclease [Polyangiaceae bacterium]